MDAACFTYEGLPVLIAQQPCDYKPPVWILGKHYDGKYEEIQKAVKACLWFTYRKGFPAIGGTGPTSDSGWGCMLRSGQMIFAEALIRRHLGRDWEWQPKDKKKEYMMVLKSFLDKKDSFYSIQQIAQMGVSEGKAIGSWFGPNTVSQVLRKLAQFDEWSKIVVHVAMDNTIVINDIRCLCKAPFNSPEKESDASENHPGTESTTALRNRHQTACNYTPDTEEHEEPFWKPVVLFIPLRLGLTNINMIYESALKKCFCIRQSLGCIGGRPNHASYFIGYHGSKLLYLDPHVTQNTVSESENISDETYHCCISPPLSMNISAIDPSLALGFYCDTEIEFNELCTSLKEVNKSSPRPIFEIIENRPPHWPPYELPRQPNVDGAHLEFVTVQSEISDIDEEYEFI
ncbi:cysteine protease ATG4B-like [Dendronephthya gigantea]|uniref:cysteine protease ATG4B-like n=1 Tax=Dendronephthya gigantea TaxID=151771 RepID=UPI00106B5BA8|nr:cysteine protease ATG4B-like [Dendronephthya gigantea]